MVKALVLFSALGLATVISEGAYASDKFRCEAKDEKADLKDVKNRKDCNAKGGKWVKVDGHDHAPGEAEHDHNGENSKKEKKK